MAEIERNLRNIDEVTKFLTNKVADEVDPETRPVEQDVKLAGDVEEAPDRPGRERGRDSAAQASSATTTSMRWSAPRSTSNSQPPTFSVPTDGAQVNTHGI